VYVCEYVRYRTYLNVVGMGSKLLGVLKGTLRWFSTGQMFKKLILKIRVFVNMKWTGNGKTDQNGTQERVREREQERGRERGR
jgi:hypothetical protein